MTIRRFPEADFGAWTSYTPTATQSGSLAVTVNRAKFKLIGKLMMVELELTPTAAGTANVAVLVGGPTSTDSPQGFQPAATANATINGFAHINGFALNLGIMAVRYVSGTTAPLFGFLRGDAPLTDVAGRDPNAAIGIGSTIHAQMFYEVL